MERKEDENIKSLRMAAELSKDVVDKQWNSIDSLIQRSALVITTVGIFLGFIFQMSINNIDVSLLCLYVLSIIFLLEAFGFAALSFMPLKIATNTKVKDLKKLCEEDEKTFLAQVISNNESFIEENRENLNKNWYYFKFSMIFFIMGLIFLATFKFVQL